MIWALGVIYLSGVAVMVLLSGIFYLVGKDMGESQEELNKHARMFFMAFIWPIVLVKVVLEMWSRLKEAENSER